MITVKSLEIATKNTFAIGRLLWETLFLTQSFETSQKKIQSFLNTQLDECHI